MWGIGWEQGWEHKIFHNTTLFGWTELQVNFPVIFNLSLNNNLCIIKYINKFLALINHLHANPWYNS